jgi:maltoporin
MPFKPLLLAASFACLSCNNAATNTPKINKSITKANIIDNPFETVSAIPLPEGYRRLPASKNSFALWLQNIALKKDKTVYLYNGQAKLNQHAQFAVMDISVGKKDLQQCADAVIRLRSEYLFAQKKYSDIIFYDNDKTAYPFNAPFTQDNFNNYLQRVFGMCGSASLSKQLKTKTDLNTITTGDVFIRGGFPGHAVIVVDAAADSAGNKIFMLAQSYMPAQQIHILKNPLKMEQPWYYLTDAEKIITPEYVFKNTELKTW